MIAIENVRLFNECRRARGICRGAGAADGDAEVLKVISRSPIDLQPVLEPSSERVRALRRQAATSFGRRTMLSLHAHSRAARPTRELGANPHRLPCSGTALGRSTLRQVAYPGVLADSDLRRRASAHQRRAASRALAVPMLREDELIGAIVLPRSRSGRSATSRSTCSRPSPTRP